MLAGIRDVDRLVELAIGIPEIQNVQPFRCLVISLTSLGPDGIATEGDLIRSYHFASAEKFERPLFLEHQNVIGMQDGPRNGLSRDRGRERDDGQRGEHSGTHPRIIAGPRVQECYAGRVNRRPSSFLFARSALLLLAGSFLVSVPQASAASWTVRAQPTRLVNGGPVLFQVKSPARLESLSGTWMGHEVPFSFDATSKTWYALAGVSFETVPGAYALELAGETQGGKVPGKKISFSRKFAVVRGKYPKIQGKLSVEGKFTEPDPEQQKQIEEGLQVKKDYLNRVTPEREWSGQFAKPADAETSDLFGTQRVFNGKAQSTHFGLDFRVPSGTPVAAMNDGTVLLARFLFFEGKFVVLDHGQGLLTMYMHLSEFKVKEGDKVKRGQEIGLSGGTGRATGPHLHVGVRWQGVSLDPAGLMRLRVPQLAVSN
jgi:murein DD-endopeptidase MepM/ murein hydrolase activator NlpD